MEFPTEYKPSDVAQILKVPKKRVLRWCDSGSLKCYRRPTYDARRIPRTSLLQYAAAHNLTVVESNLIVDQFTPSQAAMLIGVDVEAIRSLVDTDEIDGYRMLPNQSRWIMHADLIRFVHDQKIDCHLRETTTHPDHYDGRGVA